MLTVFTNVLKKSRDQLKQLEKCLTKKHTSIEKGTTGNIIDDLPSLLTKPQL